MAEPDGIIGQGLGQGGLACKLRVRGVLDVRSGGLGAGFDGKEET